MRLRRVRRQLKALVPPTLLQRREAEKISRRLRAEFDADRARYERNMMADDHLVLSRPLVGRNLEGQLTKDYHRVEKGLALRAPRQPFGEAVLARLDLLEPLAGDSDPDLAYNVSTAREALATWNRGGGVADEVSPKRDAGTRGMADAAQFFATRHSVRDFDERPVTDALLAKAVGCAIHSPSVCNRQAWQVRFYRGAEARELLKMQNGNAGFAESVPVVALVSVDTQLFAGAGERNQGWIEGGIFSMSLVWALHALGLDSCMLNMSVLNDTADELRRRTGIPDQELIIMMIAVGYGRDGHRRARSPRRAIDRITWSSTQP